MRSRMSAGRWTGDLVCGYKWEKSIVGTGKIPGGMSRAFWEF